MSARFIALLLLAGSRLAAADLIWSDEFNQPTGSGPDPTKWTYALGAGGWGNNELETYTASRENSFVVADPAATDGRALVLRALKASDGGYTSARINTQGKFAVQYGRIEARLKSSNGQGLWPAFWMLGDNVRSVGWPECGEIDVMEIVGAHPVLAHGTLHGPGYSGTGGIGRSHSLTGGATYDAAYHVFAVDWQPNTIVWSVDGVAYHTVTPATLPAGARWVFNDHPFFLLLNLAVGGGWPGNPDATTHFPQTLTIDYVRVYRAAEPTGANGDNPDARR
jgi:beta-glucanase (GH16 family)